MRAPEVLSVREFRAGLAATLKRVRDPSGRPVFIGAHRRPEAVVMSVSQYQELSEAAERREAVAEALASVRAEGLEPSPEDLELFTAVAVGELSTDQLRERVPARYVR
ncbi:type II toxin-antitoxin system prevent-host-death family antitoxin [Pseudonocardia sp. GCM10023141]|uniref:type II toxin-antitoxin system prevent-host-death family antitoxin n=1 Tax=Pseudonocardia sp. GCM10023141 TaxID=3252653 RepID=UPI0036110B6A